MGKTVIGNYHLVEEIGEGGMGIVYRAKQAGLDRIVALKVLLPHLSARERFVERFLREAKNAATLDHPNIVTIYEVGEDEGTYFFSMKYMEGGDLEDELSRGPIPIEQAVDIIRQVAQGLAHAHEKGVIHRDIKPANIIVDETGRAVITDFGIARAAWEERLTDAGISMGTVEYMSPEQFRGEEPGPESDVYALGATLYHVLTGSSPFPGKTTQEVMYQKFEGALVPPTQVNTALPEWTDHVVGAAMREDRTERIQSAREFIEALEHREVTSPQAVGALVAEAVPHADDGAGELPPAAPAQDVNKSLRVFKKVIVGVLAACIALGLAVTALFAVKALTGRTQPTPGMIPEGGTTAPAMAPPTMESPSPAHTPSAPAPAPAPAPTPEPSVRYGVITGDNVNIRSGPGVGYDKITQLDSGDSVTVLDESLAGNTSEGKLWSDTTISLEHGGGMTLSGGYAVTVVGEDGRNYRIRFDVDGTGYYGYVPKADVKLFIDDYWYQVETPSGLIGWVIDDYVGIY
ncbi:MAG: protein kinase [Deltaproteobacteria bacterium]|nr:protein kinase [Candidatus Zymogenaceae bacterium]